MDSSLIDTHCHLNYDYAPKTTDDLIREAGLAGVETLVTIGVDLTTIAPVRELSEKYHNVYHTQGVHPHEAISIQDGDLDQIRMAARHPKCRAIGEIGLDYHYDHSPRDVQLKIFRAQLDLALETDQPVVIHSRDAETELLAGLEAYARQVKGDHPKGIIHCFTGTYEFGRRCVELGFYISFSGIITFKKADDLRRCAMDFPLEQILVETDSPYLAPIPFRGKKCEPSMVKLTAQKIAEIRKISFDDVAQATTKNAKRVFRI